MKYVYETTLTLGQYQAIKAMQDKHGTLDSRNWPEITTWQDMFNLETRGIVHRVFKGWNAFNSIITFHLNPDVVLVEM